MNRRRRKGLESKRQPKAKRRAEREKRKRNADWS
jgi:hypothetical protein